MKVNRLELSVLQVGIIILAKTVLNQDANFVIPISTSVLPVCFLIIYIIINVHLHNQLEHNVQ